MTIDTQGVPWDRIPYVLQLILLLNAICADRAFHEAIAEVRRING